ncbi:MAG TPA: hypothetical protein VGF59_25665 [Bryobacteraceae bacterium]
MLGLVRRARRRVLYNELFHQGANAFSAALIAFILVLLFGSEALDWRWTLLLPLAAVGAGVYLALRRLPSAYAVAQIVDRRLGLADSISTALFFSEPGAGSRVSREIREHQYGDAERLSTTVDVRRAIPYSMPRGVYVAAALVLVASSLFALRYGISKRLDLKQPLANILQQQFRTERTETAKNERPRKTPDDPNSQDDNTDAVAQQDSQSGAADENQDDAQSQDQAEAKMEKSGGKKPGESKAENSGEQTAEDQEGEGQEGNNSSKSDSAQQNAKNGDQKQQSGSNQQSQNSGENSSLLSKMKDAFQNLMSRMKQQPGTPGSQQQSQQDPNSKQAKGQQNGGRQQAKEGQQQSAQQAGEQEGQSGEEAQNAQDPQGKGTGKSDAQQASKQPGSGIGSQDGSKDIKQAEQLAAMGKISEIIGKRSAAVTGEATVEVQSTSQTLHTPYAQRGAQHTQGGAEISRDEIPVALQTYVEQYFEQVRKPKK